MEKWLSDKVESASSGVGDGVGGNPLNMLQAILKFVDAKTLIMPDGTPVSKVPVTYNTLWSMLHVLQHVLEHGQAIGTGVLSSDLVVADFQRVQQQMVRMFPAGNVGGGGAAPAAPAAPAAGGSLSVGPVSKSDQFASDVEDEANSYFQKIYSEQMSLEEV
jgi:hypothetical protein